MESAYCRHQRALLRISASNNQMRRVNVRHTHARTQTEDKTGSHLLEVLLEEMTFDGKQSGIKPSLRLIRKLKRPESRVEVLASPLYFGYISHPP